MKNENEQERNEHFENFARLLWQELQTALHDLVREPEEIIAQRAYDLVYHALGSERTEMIYWSIPKVIQYIPDLKEWTTTPSLPPFSERDR